MQKKALFEGGNDMTKTNAKIVLSSLLIITIAFIMAAVATSIIGAWAFIPLSIVYWACIFSVVRPSKDKLVNIFTTPTENSKFALLAFVPVLFCIVSFVWGIRYINGLLLITLWVLFAVFNSVAEELFWRGYLLDNLSWNPALKILLSTLLFSLSHMAWGVFSITIRSPVMIMTLLIMGITWGYVYHKTKVLKWCIIAHFIVNIMILTVWVFLNIYIPPVIQL